LLFRMQKGIGGRGLRKGPVGNVRTSRGKSGEGGKRRSPGRPKKASIGGVRGGTDNLQTGKKKGGIILKPGPTGGPASFAGRRGSRLRSKGRAPKTFGAHPCGGNLPGGRGGGGGAPGGGTQKQKKNTQKRGGVDLRAGVGGGGRGRTNKNSIEGKNPLGGSAGAWSNRPRGFGRGGGAASRGILKGQTAGGLPGGTRGGGGIQGSGFVFGGGDNLRERSGAATGGGAFTWPGGGKPGVADRGPPADPQKTKNPCGGAIKTPPPTGGIPGAGGGRTSQSRGLQSSARTDRGERGIGGGLRAGRPAGRRLGFGEHVMDKKTLGGKGRTGGGSKTRASPLQLGARNHRKKSFHKFQKALRASYLSQKTFSFDLPSPSSSPTGTLTDPSF